LRNIRRRPRRGYNRWRARQKRIRNSEIGKWNRNRKQLGNRVVREILAGDGSLVRIFGVVIHESCWAGSDGLIHRGEGIQAMPIDALKEI
jgi:hypothetical protein